MFGDSKALARVTELQGEFEGLKRKFSTLSLEWEEFHEKVVKTLRRIALERAKIEEHEEEKSSPHTEGPVIEATSGGNGSSPSGFLTDRQKAIQQQILLRRAHLR